MKTTRWTAALALVAATLIVTAQTATTQKSKTTAATTKSATTQVRYERPAPLSDRASIILTREGYIASYNKVTRTPNWVAWHLTKAHTYGNNQRDQEVFTEDQQVPEPRATDQDYYGSRYDRGHMCPAGDNKWSAKAMTHSFLFTNVCPQNHGLNKYEWNDVEKLCRDWARKYGAVDVVCGPVFDKDAQPRYIGKNKVRVPDAFYKVVLCRSQQPKAIGFLFRNNGKKQPYAQAVCSVDEIERLTGIDFFPALDDKTENKIEATARLADW
ncbi:MAG: DNA/RNA non-specific endonuclease [Prevotella sp.]|nr:DNA/RNA non-specific endonuclease [Prevotella sp.]